MTPKTTLVVASAVSFLAGAFATGSLAYVGANRFIKDQFVATFYANAAHAQFEVRALKNLRSDRTEYPTQREIYEKALNLGNRGS